MKRIKPQILIALAALLVMLGFVVWSWLKPISWEENFKPDKKNPYGTFLIFQLLQKGAPDTRITRIKEDMSKKLPTSSKDATFISIRSELPAGKTDMDTLLAFVSAGNTAFLSLNYFPSSLQKSLLLVWPCSEDDREAYEVDIFEARTVHCNLEHPSLQMIRPPSLSIRDQDGVILYPWTHFGAKSRCKDQNSMIPMGYLNDSLVNFLRIPYGKGFFYLHTTPQAFTNYQLRREEVLEYVERVFAFTGEGPVYWDDMEDDFRDEEASNQPPAGSPLANSPLKYILSQPSLTWTWYILLFMGLSFLIFHSRRRQRIVPVLEPNTNTSLEFVTTIGRLYFLQNNHRRLCLQQMKLFQQFLRDRYSIHFTGADGVNLDKLAEKSRVPKAHIEEILRFHAVAESSRVMPEKSMMQLHWLLQEFYRICK